MPEDIKAVGLGGVGVKAGRLRALRDDVVKSLAESIAENGLLQPIVVRPKSAGASMGYWLVAGRHRLEAVRKLGWDAIEARICEGLDADHAELAEIEENLIRADLTPAEHAMHLAARKVIRERLHPETKHGGDRRSPRVRSRSQNETLKSFIDDTAAKTGMSRATIARNVRRAERGREWLGDAIGTSLDKGDEIDALIKLPELARDILITRAKNGEKVSAKVEAKKIRRAEREQTLSARITALPQERFGVILADPEWRFELWAEAPDQRRADNHYPTSDLQAIKDRDVASIAAADCILFLWATAPMLPQALEVMAAWGFKYVTNAVWVKDRIGTGYWFRSCHEHLLLGVRGNVPAPAPGQQWDSVIEQPRDAHSAKPDAAHDLIEDYFPNTPKIELNARKARPGWSVWGAEAPES